MVQQQSQSFMVIASSRFRYCYIIWVICMWTRVLYLRWPDHITYFFEEYRIFLGNRSESYTKAQQIRNVKMNFISCQPLAREMSSNGPVQIVNQSKICSNGLVCWLVWLAWNEFLLEFRFCWASSHLAYFLFIEMSKNSLEYLFSYQETAFFSAWIAFEVWKQLPRIRYGIFFLLCLWMPTEYWHCRRMRPWTFHDIFYFYLVSGCVALQWTRLTGLRTTRLSSHILIKTIAFEFKRVEESQIAMQKSK